MSVKIEMPKKWKDQIDDLTQEAIDGGTDSIDLFEAGFDACWERVSPLLKYMRDQTKERDKKRLPTYPAISAMNLLEDLGLSESDEDTER